MRKILAFLSVNVINLFVISSAFASGGGDAHGGGHDAAKSVGVPQLDFTTYPTQIFWAIICFLLTYIFVGKIALPRIMNVVERRHEKVQNDLDKSEEMQTEAEGIQSAYEAAVAKARKEAYQIIKEENHRLEADVAKWAAELDLNINKRIKQAEPRITKIKQDVMKDLVTVSEDLTHQVIEKFMNRKISDGRVSEAVGNTAKNIH
ncbi:MAG: F0F1 ATP synthase subunit B family protein [Alphaproteobacteria bacterium]